jgi:hypothetical protein
MANIEKIRTSISNVDGEVLKDTLAILLSSKNSATTNSTRSANSPDVQNFDNFAQVISWLKSKYDFQELRAFYTEADLVYVNTGDRKVLLSDTSVKPVEIEKRANSEFDDAWEPVISKTQIERNETRRQEEKKLVTEGSQDINNAFEPLKKKGRFSNLEL